MSTHSSNLESVMIDHGPFLRRLALSLVRDPADADDVVQDVWIAAATSNAGPMREPRAWLASVLRRRVASERRRPRPQALGSAPDCAHPRAAAQDEVALQLEREAELQGALAALSEPYRTALYLRYHDGLKPKAIAERMDAPVKTVNSWLHRGLEKLRSHLDHVYGGGDEGRAAWLSSMAVMVTRGRGESATAVAGGAGSKAAVLCSVAACVVVTLGVALWWTARSAGATPAGGRAGGASPVGGGMAAASLSPAPRPTPLVRVGAAGPAAASTPGTGGAEASIGAGGSFEPRSLPENAAPTAEAMTMGGTVNLEITVRGTDGAPAADEVLVLRQNGWRGLPGHVELATTDAGGRLSFRVDRDLRYVVTDLVGSQWIHVFYDGEDAGAGDSLAKEFVLGATTRVTGRVLDGDGSAQPGAVIYGAAFDRDPPIWFPVGQADAAGHYDLQAGPDMCFEAVVSGRLPSEAVQMAYAPSGPNGGREVDLVVGPAGAALSGRVVDGTGAPIVGAAILAGPLGRMTGSLASTRRPSPVLGFSGPDGRFVYPAALPTGDQPIAVSAEGFAIHRQLVTFGAEPADLTVVLQQGVTIEGRVLKLDGSPSPGTRVHLHEPGTRWSDSFYGPGHGDYTDDEGRFALRHVDVDAGELLARNSMGSITSARMPWSRTSNGPVEIRLGEGRVIAGRVVNRAGQPIAGLLVDASTVGIPGVEGRVVTDAEGRFRLSSLPHPASLPADHDVRWQVSALANTHAMYVAVGSLRDVAPGTLDVEIVADIPAPATAFIEGHIVSPDGPIPGNAALFLSHQTGKRLIDETNRSIPFDRATGAFRCGPLTPGHYGLVLDVPEVGEIASIEGIEVGQVPVVEVGDLTVGAGGTARFTLEVELPAIFPDGMLPGLMEDQRLELVSPYRRYGLESTAGGWRTAYPMPAGTYELQRRRGEILCFPRIPVTIVGEEEAQIQVEAIVGRPTMIWVLMDTATDWKDVELRFFNAAGELVQVSRKRERADLNEEDSMRFREAVPRGPIRVEVWIDGADSGKGAGITVLDFTEPMDPITIDAR